jgi:hypothetical protein
VQLSEAARTFGLTDREKDQYLAGVVPASFFLVGAPAAVLVRAADLFVKYGAWRGQRHDNAYGEDCVIHVDATLPSTELPLLPSSTGL